MSVKTKAILLFVLGVLTLVAGEYLSGFLMLKLLQETRVPLGVTTYWQYFHARELPQFLPYALKIKLSGAIGFGLPLLAWAALSVRIFQSQAESTHGEASFATLADLKKAGVLTQTPESILIGKYKGRYLWLGGPQHVITISPTRSGKTASIAVPTLVTYGGSMVVLDVKGELHKQASGQREAMRQVVYKWAPYDDQGETHRFNPMTLLADMAPGKRIAEIQTIAAILYPDHAGNDPFFTAQSRTAFTAVTSYLFEVWDRGLKPMVDGKAHPLNPDINASPDFPSFERVLHFSSGSDSQSTRVLLQSILKDAGHSFISKQTRAAFSALAGMAEETFSSVIATMQAPLQQFLSPILAAATNASDFDIRDLRKKLITLFVIIPTNKLDESSKLLNIFFSSVIGNNLDKQLGEDLELKHQVLMLMDEFTAMGRVDVWAKRISISASYGVRDLCIVQSRAQLRAAYGNDDAQNFITTHCAQIVFAPREQSDANEYSEMLGYKTVRKQNRSTSRGGGASQVSTSYSEERRALLLPQEIKELPANDELIFLEGCKPIRAQKNWFFKDKALKERTGLPPSTVERAEAVTVSDVLGMSAQKPKSNKMREAMSRKAA